MGENDSTAVKTHFEPENQLAVRDLPIPGILDLSQETLIATHLQLSPEIAFRIGEIVFPSCLLSDAIVD